MAKYVGVALVLATLAMAYLLGRKNWKSDRRGDDIWRGGLLVLLLVMCAAAPIMLATSDRDADHIGIVLLLGSGLLCALGGAHKRINRAKEWCDLQKKQTGSTEWLGQVDLNELSQILRAE